MGTDTITFKVENKKSVEGYMVCYRPLFGGWKNQTWLNKTDEWFNRTDEFNLRDNTIRDNITGEFTLRDLSCGTEYQLYLYTYYPSFGEAVSKVVDTKTKGEKPTAPNKGFLESYAGSATINLDAWEDNGCIITNFVIQYKQKCRRNWSQVWNSVKPGGNFVILDLTPSTWYQLKVTSHNNAGSTDAVYEFATKTKTGGEIHKGTSKVSDRSMTMTDGEEGGGFTKGQVIDKITDALEQAILRIKRLEQAILCIETWLNSGQIVMVQ